MASHDSANQPPDSVVIPAAGTMRVQSNNDLRLYFGAQGIRNLYIGAVKINKAYIGSTLLIEQPS